MSGISAGRRLRSLPEGVAAEVRAVPDLVGRLCRALAAYTQRA